MALKIFSILILLNGCVPLPIGMPKIPSIHDDVMNTSPRQIPANTLKMSKAGGTREQMMAARMDCLENHKYQYFNCMGAKGWNVDAKGFAPPNYWEKQ